MATTGSSRLRTTPRGIAAATAVYVAMNAPRATARTRATPTREELAARHERMAALRRAPAPAAEPAHVPARVPAAEKSPDETEMEERARCVRILEDVAMKDTKFAQLVLAAAIRAANAFCRDKDFCDERAACLRQADLDEAVGRDYMDEPFVPISSADAVALACYRAREILRAHRHVPRDTGCFAVDEAVYAGDEVSEDMRTLLDEVFTWDAMAVVSDERPKILLKLGVLPTDEELDDEDSDYVRVADVLVTHVLALADLLPLTGDERLAADSA